MKAAIVTGIVTPYTHRGFEALGRRLDGALHVFACSDHEPGRHWQPRRRPPIAGGRSPGFACIAAMSATSI